MINGAGEREHMTRRGSRRGKRHSPSEYWLITHGDGEIPSPFTTRFGGEALPVFGFEEEADMFLKFSKLEDPESGRRLRRATTGELLSILSGPCKNFGWVAFDPLPTLFTKPAHKHPRMEREKFMMFLARENARMTTSRKGG